MEKENSCLPENRFSETIKLGRKTYLIKREFSGTRNILDCIKTAIAKPQTYEDDVLAEKEDAPH